MHNGCRTLVNFFDAIDGASKAGYERTTIYGEHSIFFVGVLIFGWRRFSVWHRVFSCHAITRMQYGR